MSEVILKILGIVCLLGGSVLSVICLVGLIRLQDPYSQLHVTGKLAFFGACLYTLSAVFLIGLNPFLAGFVVFLLLFVTPLVSHILGATAFRRRLPMHQAVRNDFEQN